MKQTLSRSDAGAPASTTIVALRIAATVGFALAMVAAAHVRIPVPGTPVPITLQSMVAPLAALALGPWLGSASMAFYLLLGITGTQAFAVQSSTFPGWSAATGGYLLGFLLAQPLTGWLTGVRRGGPAGVVRLAAAIVAANIVIFGCGLLWLHFALGGGDWARTLELGLWPFAIGSIAKCVGTGLLGWVALRWMRPSLGLG